MNRKIVLRMLDGTMKKCNVYTHFSSAYKHIKVVTVEGKLETVDISKVKAIFFVRDFAGNPDYRAEKHFGEGSPNAGRSVTVTFPDGEVLRGKVLNFAEERQGFFLFPADPLDNNEKIYVIRSPDLRVEVEP